MDCLMRHGIPLPKAKAIVDEILRRLQEDSRSSDSAIIQDVLQEYGFRERRIEEIKEELLDILSATPQEMLVPRVGGDIVPPHFY